MRIVLAPIPRFDHFASGEGVMKSGLRRGRIVAKQRVAFGMEDRICKGLMRHTKVGCIKMPLFAARSMLCALEGITVTVRVV